MNSHNETPVPPVEAVLKAKEIAESASAAAVDQGHHFNRDKALTHFARELQTLAPHFPDNQWLREKALTLPGAIDSGRVPSVIFDELKLGCQDIFSRFQHLLHKESANTAEANAA